MRFKWNPKIFLYRGKHEVTFEAATSEAERWDLYERGPRLFNYRIPLETAVANLVSTLALFEPILTEPVQDLFAKPNLNFLRDNAGIEMPERPEGYPEIMPVDKNLFMNGDTVDIMRLDGLDPMIAWAMGAATGHTAIALWKEDEVNNYWRN